MASQSILQAQGDVTWNTQLVDHAGSGGSIALDSYGNPHIAYALWSFENDSTSTSLNYAVWTGTNWAIQTVDPSGSSGLLALDSMDRPHIIYTVGYDLKYAVLNGKNWDIQTIDSSGMWIRYSMALDSNGNPHVVYSTFNYYKNYVNNSETEDIKYAVLDGANWAIQTIDSVNVTVGNISPSIALDSSNNPHMIYLETVQFQYPNKNSWNNLSFWETYNVKYASLTGSSWLVQTVVTNSTAIGNLVLDSKGQPSFCYIHENFSFIPESSSFQTSGSMNYAYWNGYAWLSRAIDSKPSSSGQTYLNLDSNGNPQVYFYVENYQKPTDSGLMYTQWTGSSWNIQNIGSIPSNSDYYQSTANIADIAFDAHGKLSLTYDGEVGTIRSAPIYGDLTYASLETPLTSAPDHLLIIISVAITAVTILIVVLIIYKKKRSKG
jgi:hypothetical protein